jgi:AcrR family transcriptional regulator
VAPRTVYVRFGTKQALFQRVMGVAVVGDTDPVDLANRDWAQRALTAATLQERLQNEQWLLTSWRRLLDAAAGSRHDAGSHDTHQ